MERLLAYQVTRDMQQRQMRTTKVDTSGGDAAASCDTRGKRKWSDDSTPLESSSPPRSSKRRKSDVTEFHSPADGAAATPHVSSPSASTSNLPTSLDELLRTHLLGTNSSSSSSITFPTPIEAGIIAVQVENRTPTNQHGTTPHSSPTANHSRLVELSWAHSTRHFGIGYMQRGESPRAFLSDSSANDISSLVGVSSLFPHSSSSTPVTAGGVSPIGVTSGGVKFRLDINR